MALEIWEAAASGAATPFGDALHFPLGGPELYPASLSTPPPDEPVWLKIGSRVWLHEWALIGP